MHNDSVINYALRWAHNAVQQDLDKVYQDSDADGLYLDGLFDLLEQNDVIRA